ncbi:MAG: hypothetical protein WCH86_05040 [Kiritimatiellales bacterium]
MKTPAYIWKTVLGLALLFGSGSSVFGASEAALWYEGDAGGTIRDEGDISGIWTKIACYPVNRGGDFMDMLSLQFGFGFGLHANAHATRAAQVGFGGAAVSRFGFDGRQGGLCNESKAEFSLLPFTMETFRRSNAFGGFTDYSIPEDSATLYRLHRDYTGVGAEATAGIVNVGGEIHPVEVLDFVVGFLGLDLSSDDYPQPWDGNARLDINADAVAKIKRVVIVPSRVVADRRVRLEAPDGIGVYYDRFPAERHWGLLGALFVKGADAQAASEFSSHLARKQFSVHRELLERMARMAMVSRKWDVVSTDEMLKAFDAHAVVKEYRGEKVKRLPNYARLAAHYGADAVLDVRVWEYGVWRKPGTDTGVMRLDCEIKLIAQPSNEVLFDARIVHCPMEKGGLSLLEFAKAGKTDDNLMDECRQACDVVMAKFKDMMLEQH